MTMIRQAEILCVGTELLLGQITNTNAAWLARELSLTGIHSYYQTVVGDNPDRLSFCIEQAAERSDLVILTGGLGPTQDDITMAVAAQVAGIPLRLHEPSRRAIAGYFSRIGRHQVTENNWKQAMMPDPSIVLPNNNGTAPGAIISLTRAGHACYLILLPGPPGEMQLMYRESVAPWLAPQTGSRLRHLFVHLIGIGESAAETQLLDLINGQKNPTLASYASDGEVMFRITQSVASETEPDQTLDMLAQVRQRVGDYIYEVGPRSMAEVVMDLLRAKKQTVSFAESCTGGLAAAQFTDIPGVSAVFKGGVIAYDNKIKQQVLGVSQSILEQEGAVSEACAIAMAIGCRDMFETDYAVSITGIAGPDGGSSEKPVGLVYLAIAGPEGQESRRLQMRGNRERIRKVSVLNAFDLLRKRLLQ